MNGNRIFLYHRARLRVIALLIFSALSLAAAEPPPATSCTWPQAYSVQYNKGAGWLTLRTPYYTVRHDLKKGGAISSIRLTHCSVSNLLVQSFETRVQDASGQFYSDLMDSSPRVSTRREGLNERITVESGLLNMQGRASGIRVKTVYEYRWVM